MPSRPRPSTGKRPPISSKGPRTERTSIADLTKTVAETLWMSGPGLAVPAVFESFVAESSGWTC